MARNLEMGAYCINASDTHYHWLGTNIDSSSVLATDELRCKRGSVSALSAVP